MYSPGSKRNTSYFFQKEIANAKTNNMTKLTDDNGKTYTDPKEIMEQTRQFYQTLYKQQVIDAPEDQDMADAYFLKDNQIPTIDNDDRDLL